MAKKRKNPFGNLISIAPPEFPEEKPFEIPDERYRKLVESFVKKHLRPASLEWNPRNAAEIAARVERGRSRCAECKEIINNYRPALDKKTGNPLLDKRGNPKRTKNFHMDHIQPVQPVGREISLIEWIFRLLCPQENFQLICIPCHEIKTQHENMLREVRKLLKPKKKK